MNVESNDIKALASDFLDYLLIEKTLSPLTIVDYRHYLDRFIEWLESGGYPLHPQSIDLDLIMKYRVFLANFKTPKGIGIKKITQNYHIICLRSFLRYLITHRDINTLNPDKIDLPKSEGRVVSFLNSEQLSRLLNSPQISDEIGLRDRAILELLFSTGLRVSELSKLNRDQMNFETKEFGV